MFHHVPLQKGARFSGVKMVNAKNENIVIALSQGEPAESFSPSAKQRETWEVFSGCTLRTSILIPDSGGSLVSPPILNERVVDPSYYQILRSIGTRLLYSFLWFNKTLAQTKLKFRGATKQDKSPRDPKKERARFYRTVTIAKNVASTHRSLSMHSIRRLIITAVSSVSLPPRHSFSSNYVPRAACVCVLSSH